eukprot:m.427593 g.427593  ORF g.427593 m.427593 type:complete len:172 (+) comp21363_c1_seq8:1050-1565(+)
MLHIRIGPQYTTKYAPKSLAVKEGFGKLRRKMPTILYLLDVKMDLTTAAMHGCPTHMHTVRVGLPLCLQITATLKDARMGIAAGSFLYQCLVHHGMMDESIHIANLVQSFQTAAPKTIYGIRMLRSSFRPQRLTKSPVGLVHLASQVVVSDDRFSQVFMAGAAFCSITRTA